jgi:hypothetical protein
MLMATSAAASANFAFCMDDPPITTTTPGGTTLTVNTQVYLPAGSQQLKNDVYETSSVQPDGHGGTLVTVNVYVPAQAHVVATVKKYQVSASGDGNDVVTVQLDVPVS